MESLPALPLLWSLPEAPLPIQHGASLTQLKVEVRPTALSLLHVLPIAIVQVADYLTDLMCSCGCRRSDRRSDGLMDNRKEAGGLRT